MDQSANHILLRGNQPGAADRMRELLARTVQDHVSDQRSNAGAFEEIRQRLEGLEWLVKEVREREFTNLASHLDGLAGQLDETREKPPGWAESLAEHIEVLGTQVRPIAELPALWADLGVVSENVEQTLPRLQAVCDTITQALDVLRVQDERLGKLQQTMGKLHQGMEAAAGRFTRLDKAIAELTQRAGHLDKEMSAVRGRVDQGFSALTAKVEQGMEAVTARIEQGTEAVTARVEQGAEATSVKIEQGLAATLARVDGVAASVAGWQADRARRAAGTAR
jgi:chromosome segregation ATPase